MATISNTPRPGYVYDSTDGVWYPIGTGAHTHSDYITSSSAINPTIVDAKGDIIAATAADTVDRLAVGANDTVLTADSSTATGLKWATPAAGGITLLSTTTLSGTSVTVSSISQAYTNLIIRIDNPSVGAVAGDSMTFRLNSTSTSSYNQTRFVTTGTSLFNRSAMTKFYIDNLFTDEAATTGWAEISILDYANTGSKKSVTVLSQNNSTNTQFMIGSFNVDGAITSITVADDSSRTFDGGTIKIYGVK